MLLNKRIELLPLEGSHKCVEDAVGIWLFSFLTFKSDRQELLRGLTEDVCREKYLVLMEEDIASPLMLPAAEPNTSSNKSSGSSRS
ncbi:hypothetical protein OIU77_020197 [Salix suchowensis]|uniref:Uncharacterized protein n=1 Tax=Salix suchowensis TaxID=1278906 RepID=A0ABQ9CIU4_9ROSI|nr:hypothetical protein OIU77_020197 [Salix suchowensis]